MPTETCSSVVPILFGWLLGLLTPIMSHVIRQIYDAREIKSAIKIELVELQYRLALSANHLDMNYGDADKEHIVFSKKIIDRYEGANKKKNIKDLIDRLSVASDEELNAFYVSTQAKSSGASLLKKHLVPFIDSKISSLAWVNEKLRNQILEIKANLNMLDETIDDSRYFFNLTFQNLSEENQNRARNELVNSYKNYSSRAKLISSLIEKIDFIK